MLNLLIAVMGDSFERVKEREASAARHEQAAFIVAREKLFVGLGLWKRDDDRHFPCYMVIAQEVEQQLLRRVICKDGDALVHQVLNLRWV